MNIDVSTAEFKPEALEKILAEAEITQSDFNNLVGYANPNTVNKIVRKSRKATATDLIKFCLLLGKQPADFAKN